MDGGFFYARTNDLGKQKHTGQVPVLQALLLADRVYRIDGDGMVIAGTIDRLTLRKRLPPEEIETPDGTKAQIVRPVRSAAPYVYISLTDVTDNTKITLQLVSLKKNRVLLSTTIDIEKGERLGTTQIVAPLPALDMINEPGVYALEVVCEDEIVGMHRVTVTLDPENQQDPNQ